jgi:hypothetical protein
VVRDDQGENVPQQMGVRPPARSSVAAAANRCWRVATGLIAHHPSDKLPTVVTPTDLSRPLDRPAPFTSLCPAGFDERLKAL